MFDTLLESPSIGARWTRAVTAALIFHILLIAAALSRTASFPAGLPRVTRDTIRLELGDVRPSPTRAKARPPGLEPIVPAPFDVPDIDLDVPELPLSSLRYPSLSYYPPNQLQFNPGLRQRSPGGGASSFDTTPPVFDAPVLDELPVLLAQPYPRYPDGLRRAGMSGVVQLQFVVGSDGRVDDRSIRVLVSSHPGFTLAAFQALRESRFKPARRGGRPTAVLVEQTIRFSYR
ncbi:MAG: periplasmic protein TonB [Gemmatimonadales bacterium]|jgi:protein TonB|nr:periplasmic protein TonB [Gemmatimonadales bacterium]